MSGAVWGRATASISQDNGGPDVFAHYSEIRGNGSRNLSEGEHATVEIGQGQKGPQAQDIVQA
ncbi:cold-shock protein [Streptomyces sp. NPDC051644]|uniref:cold-shock protein n=1 Tax=Streptomyces sp. NPDC051644 TaxID=3365666 RepID=UPI0037B15E9A